jgi:quinohemoprotein amine dehydrogenase
LKQISKKSALLIGGFLALAGNGTFAAAAQPMSGEQIIQQQCTACHTKTGDASKPYSRISQQRKTPEGWQMTLHRMVSIHQAKISDAERKRVLKYLADTQGLAPAETSGLRYGLERDGNLVENNDPAYAEMCARCHSGARFGLQRRTRAEWDLLVQFHMGQIPTLELHSLARDRPWFELAMNEVAPKLAEDFPFETAAWKAWQAADKPTFAHAWTIAGYIPGKGDFDAVMQVRDQGDDRYALEIAGHYADGSPLSGRGRAITYTGYEWRAALTLDGMKLRQILAANEQGTQMTGRLFMAGANELGAEMVAQRAAKGDHAVIRVTPSHIRQGTRQEITLVGAGLQGAPELGDGVRVIKTLSVGTNRMRLLVEADERAAVGLRDIRVGQIQAPGMLAVFDQVARVEVVPGESIARIGGNGMPVAKVKSAYRAVGYAAGADGKPGTADDIRLGHMPASWTLKAFDETAEQENDLKYAGTIDANGIFTPGDAGPNPERKMSTNNVGNLSVVGSVDDGGGQVSGEAHLLVTVQRFVRSSVQ